MAMQRVCFVLQVKPDRLEEYRERHRTVWPEMREALTSAGWHNYSLFLRDDGMLIGYVESEDFDRSRRLMAETPINAVWQASMKDFFVDADGRTADKQMKPLEQVFFLP